MVIQFDVCSRAAPTHVSNQDSVFTMNEPVIAAGVFDGVGAVAGGDLASAIAKTEFARLLSTAENPHSFRLLRSSFRRVRDLIRTQALSRFGCSQMATTALVVLLSETSGLTWANIGDCQLYAFRAGQISKVLPPDSLLQMIVERDLLSRAQADRINGVTKFGDLPRSVQRHLGAAGFYIRDLGTDHISPVPQIGKHDLRRGDVWLLCTDGVADNLSSDDLSGILGSRTQGTAEALVELAYARSVSGTPGTHTDDMTALLIRVD